MSFADLGLSPEVLRAVDEAGYAHPTPIQSQAVPYVLMGRDVLGCAQTGTGKTASFTLPMIDILASGRAKARMPRSLILAPTRELAAQVSENFELYGKHSKLSMALLTGGSSLADQERRLDRGVDVLIATPGRLLDLFGRGKILLADVKILVIDEADRMLDMGFIPDVERIVGLLPKIRQTLFFSATMPPEVRRLADAFLINPKAISVDPPSSAAETVIQALIKVRGEARDKRAALRTLLNADNVTSALIFCNRKRDVDVVFKSLKKHGYSVAALHGDMAQPARTATLKAFKNAEIELLVCSDVAARGLDIPAVSHVINFDVPIHSEDYIHRIGRTGRAGRSGKSFTFALPSENKALAGVNAMLGHPIPLADSSDITGWDDSEAPPAKSGRRRARSRAATPTKRPARSRARRKETAPADADMEAAPTKAAESSSVESPSVESPSVESPAAEAAVPPAPAKEPAPAKPRAERRPRKRSEAAEEAEVSSKPFGEHTPAFMLRPVKVA